MQIKANKTWSQQQLAIKLHAKETVQAGLLSWERQRLLIHAAKTALAAALCWWLVLRFGLHDGYWGSISAIIVLQSNVGSTVTASRDRILGTIIGAIIGFSFSLFGTLPWNYILAVLTEMGFAIADAEGAADADAGACANTATGTAERVASKNESRLVT